MTPQSSPFPEVLFRELKIEPGEMQLTQLEVILSHLIHWYGKALPEMIGGRDIKTLPVLLSENGNEKLQGVPKINAGTGENEANTVYGFLQEWKLTEKVQAMSFDTTSVKTGRYTGVCKCLEDKLGRDLLWLAYRKFEIPDFHILELILAKDFSLCFGPSNSPEIPLFKKFKAN